MNMAAAVPTMTRDSTMKITAEEGINFLKAEGENTLLKMQGLIPDKMPRDNTMVGTAKEAEGVLASMGGAPDSDAKTRDQAKKIDEITTAPPEKKAKVKRETTMATTAKAGEEFVDREKKARKSPGKRTSTIAKCIAESGTEVNVNEGRRTRNAGKTKPPPPAPVPKKKAAPKKKTAAKGKKAEAEEEKPDTDEASAEEEDKSS